MSLSQFEEIMQAVEAQAAVHDEQMGSMESTMSDQPSQRQGGRQAFQSIQDGITRIQDAISADQHQLLQVGPALGTDQEGSAALKSKVEELQRRLQEQRSRCRRLALAAQNRCPPSKLDTVFESRGTSPANYLGDPYNARPQSRVVTRTRSLVDQMFEEETKNDFARQISLPVSSSTCIHPNKKVAKTEPEEMDVAKETPKDDTADEDASMSEKDDRSYSFSVDMALDNGQDTGARVVYSWGRGDLGALLHSDVEDHKPEEVAFRRALQALNGIASSAYHTMAVTQTGELYGCGTNMEGQVRPDRSEEIIPELTLFDSLSVQRITQVACGLYHTACVTSTGTLITFGGNEAGQLGHSVKGEAGQGPLSRNNPRTVHGVQGSIICKVACGDLFTVAVSVIGECFSFGIGTCTGHKDGQNRYRAEKIAGLACVPIASVAARGEHTFALSSMGTAFAWGCNAHGQVGVEASLGGYVQTPVLVATTLQTKMAVVACGSEHSVLLSTTGKVFGCGRNTHFQLGHSLPQSQVCPLAHLPCSEGSVFSLVACGDNHTLLLDTKGLLWGLGQNSNLQIGVEDREDQPNLVQIVLPGLPEKGEVFFITAGGDHSFALSAPGQPFERMSSTSLSGCPIGRMFSIVRAARPMTTQDMMAVLEEDQKTGDPESSVQMMRDIFSNPYLLNSSFLSDETASGLDIEGLATIYKLFLTLGKNLETSRALVVAMARASGQLEREASNLPPHQDAMRAHLALWQCPLMSSPQLSKDVFAHLCTSLLSFSSRSRVLYLELVDKDIPKHVFATRFVKPLQEHLSYHLGVDAGRGTLIPTIVYTMKILYNLNEYSEKVPRCSFYNITVSELQDPYLYNDMREWKLQKQQAVQASRRFYFCEFPFLLSADAKRRLLQLDSLISQNQAGQEALRSGLMRGVLSSAMQFLILPVQRAFLLQSTLAQLSSFSDADLKKHLKVVFVGEEGIDEGGVKKEFFQLLVEHLFDIIFGMFQLCGMERDYWFNKDCVWSNNEFNLIGILFGLAIYNGVVLDVHFPLAIYKKLLHQDLTLKDLGDIDEELMKGLQQLLDYTEDDVEDVFCRSFEVVWDDLGATRSYELKPGGKNLPVTKENKEEYVKLYVNWMLSDSIQQQFEHFYSGFMRVMNGASLTLLQADELELLVAGEPHLDFKELEKVAEYEGYPPEHPVIKFLWNVVQQMDLDYQRKFLMFVTGSMKAPLGGLGKLKFKVQRMGPDSDQLPTSHTCFNTLLLPEYNSEEKLKERLMIAISECEGFGLK